MTSPLSEDSRFGESETTYRHLIGLCCHDSALHCRMLIRFFIFSAILPLPSVSLLQYILRDPNEGSQKNTWDAGEYENKRRIAPSLHVGQQPGYLVCYISWYSLAFASFASEMLASTILQKRLQLQKRVPVSCSYSAGLSILIRTRP
jgi:hypothetical protein